MQIDIIDRELVVRSEEEALTDICRSQLLFWGFKNGGENVFVAPLDQQLFLKISNYFSKEEIPFVLSKSAADYSNKLEVINLNFEGLKEVAKKFKNGKYDRVAFDQFKEFVATNIYRNLRSHQIKAAYHLYLIGNGANFSVPGSGKTTVVLTVYEKLRLEGKVNTLFVVGPPSSFGPWKSEFKDTLGRTPNTLIMAGGNKIQRKGKYYEKDTRSELYLTTFQSLLSDEHEVSDFLNQKQTNAFFVVDEAHYIKQIKGNWAQAILNQAQQVKFRAVLTGTPMPKSYLDIFNLFDFLWPNQNPISSGLKAHIKYNESHGNHHSVKNTLQSTIGPLFYRVRKKDLNLKPQIFHSPQYLEMNKYESILYDAIFRKIKNYAKDEYYQNIEFVTKLGSGRIMRLRQAVSYPKLLTTAIDDYSEKLIDDMADLKNIVRKYDDLEMPSKLQHLLKMIKGFQRSRQKVVVWSNFVGTIILIERTLKQANIYCKKIHGSTPIENSTMKLEDTREKIRDEFVNADSGLDVLIANPAACAESISLHKTCHNAIYYDLSYNCAQYLQSLDRIHRVGGSENFEAHYHYLHYKGTVDTDIKSNLDEKTKKMLAVIDEDYPIYTLDVSDEEGDSEAYKRLFVNKKRVKKRI